MNTEGGWGGCGNTYDISFRLASWSGGLLQRREMVLICKLREAVRRGRAFVD